MNIIPNSGLSWNVVYGDVFRLPVRQDAVMLPFNPVTGIWASEWDLRLYNSAVGRHQHEPILSFARGKSSLFHDRLLTELAQARMRSPLPIPQFSGETFLIRGTSELAYGNFEHVIFMADRVYAESLKPVRPLISLKGVLEYALAEVMMLPDISRVAFPFFRSELIGAPSLTPDGEHEYESVTYDAVLRAHADALLSVARKYTKREITLTLVFEREVKGPFEFETLVASLM